ncbi:MAG TPA: hypothetical protein DCZ69_15525 [Syntrophobacteraceae bacterium]|nr:hypothetical protein [Syntrophobacteraceae bacterium]
MIGIALGPIEIRVALAGYNDGNRGSRAGSQRNEIRIEAMRVNQVRAEFPQGVLDVADDPSGLKACQPDRQSRNPIDRYSVFEKTLRLAIAWRVVAHLRLPPPSFELASHQSQVAIDPADSI